MKQIKSIFSMIVCTVMLVIFILPLTFVTKVFDKFDKDWY